jgi:hypothetical protein
MLPTIDAACPTPPASGVQALLSNLLVLCMPGRALFMRRERSCSTCMHDMSCRLGAGSPKSQAGCAACRLSEYYWQCLPKGSLPAAKPPAAGHSGRRLLAAPEAAVPPSTSSAQLPVPGQTVPPQYLPGTTWGPCGGKGELCPLADRADCRHVLHRLHEPSVG